MKYEYSENVLVQDSAAALMHDELGWDVVFAYNQEVLGDNGTLGRKDFHEIVMTDRPDSYADYNGNKHISCITV